MRIIVPYAPGGTIDITARLMMSKLFAGMGPAGRDRQPRRRRRHYGANMVAKASADGYTLLLAAASELTIAQTIIKNVRSMR